MIDHLPTSAGCCPSTGWDKNPHDIRLLKNMFCLFFLCWFIEGIYHNWILFPWAYANGILFFVDRPSTTWCRMLSIGWEQMRRLVARGIFGHSFGVPGQPPPSPRWPLMKSGGRAEPSARCRTGKMDHVDATWLWVKNADPKWNPENGTKDEILRSPGGFILTHTNICQPLFMNKGGVPSSVGNQESSLLEGSTLKNVC